MRRDHIGATRNRVEDMAQPQVKTWDKLFLVETAFTRELIGPIFETGKLASLCRQLPIANANSIKIPAINEVSRATGSRLGGIQAYWLSEAGTKTASMPKFREMELVLKKLVGLCYATDELIQDSVMLGSIIRAGFIDEFGFQIDDAIVNGSGVGQPLGILTSGSTVSVTRASGGSIVAADLFNMWARCINPSKSVWIINQDCIPTLYNLSVTVGTTGGSPVFVPPGGLSASPYSTLLGRPIIFCEQAQTVGTSGDIILANLAEGYLIVSKPITADISVHVRFINDESVFRSTKQAAFGSDPDRNSPQIQGNLNCATA